MHFSHRRACYMGVNKYVSVFSYIFCITICCNFNQKISFYLWLLSRKVVKSTHLLFICLIMAQTVTFWHCNLLFFSDKGCGNDCSPHTNFHQFELYSDFRYFCTQLFCCHSLFQGPSWWHCYLVFFLSMTPFDHGIFFLTFRYIQKKRWLF